MPFMPEGLTRQERNLWSQGLYDHARRLKDEREASEAGRLAAEADMRAGNRWLEQFEVYTALREAYDAECAGDNRWNAKHRLAVKIEQMEEQHRDFRETYERKK